MKMFYFSHDSGYDFVAQADSLGLARDLLYGCILKNIGNDEVLKEWAPSAQPVGIFHYAACIEIFTECNPEMARAAEQEWQDLRMLVLHGVQGWTNEDLALAERYCERWAKLERVKPTGSTGGAA